MGESKKDMDWLPETADPGVVARAETPRERPDPAGWQFSALALGTLRACWQQAIDLDQGVAGVGGRQGVRPGRYRLRGPASTEPAGLTQTSRLPDP